MAVTQELIKFIGARSIWQLVFGFVAILIGYIATQYYKNPLRKYPGPFLAKISPLWLLYHARFGQRWLAVHTAHLQYGRFVVIAPNQLSIADKDAIKVVYGHSTGFLKAPFYDAFVASATRGLFNTRDRKEHSRKRRIISHTFSQQNVLKFEKYIHEMTKVLTAQLDKICSGPAPDFAQGDILPWFNYLAFDIIGELAFGEAFGMLERGADNGAIETLNKRGTWSATVGTIPSLRKVMRYFYLDPFFVTGSASVRRLTQIARDKVDRRLAKQSDRQDLLARLMEAKDPDTGKKMEKNELVAEALTQLIAGSDTTSNTLTHMLHLLLLHPKAHETLLKELKTVLPDRDTIPLYETVKGLPYLNGVISETLRYRSTSTIGLPRVVPPQGAMVAGEFFQGGTVLSVPSHDIHHDPKIWGDPDNYRPERWLAGKNYDASLGIPSDEVDESDDKDLNKYLLSFSTGPRGCLGRNVAWLELTTVFATFIRRYECELVHPEESVDLVEGFLLKPSRLNILIRKRDD